MALGAEGEGCVVVVTRGGGLGRRRLGGGLTAGRLRAQELGVTEVPTVVVDGAENIVGVPDDIDDLRRRILESPGDGGSG